MMYLSCHCMRFVQTDAESALRLADYTTVCLCQCGKSYLQVGETI